MREAAQSGRIGFFSSIGKDIFHKRKKKVPLHAWDRWVKSFVIGMNAYAQTSEVFPCAAAAIIGMVGRGGFVKQMTDQFAEH